MVLRSKNLMCIHESDLTFLDQMGIGQIIAPTSKGYDDLKLLSTATDS